MQPTILAGPKGDTGPRGPTGRSGVPGRKGNPGLFSSVLFIFNFVFNILVVSELQGVIVS